MSKIKHILSVIHYTISYTIFGAVCFQFTHSPCDDWENIYTLSYYHHQIGSMNYYPFFRVRSWNNGVRCMSFYILRVFKFILVVGAGAVVGKLPLSGRAPLVVLVGQLLHPQPTPTHPYLPPPPPTDPPPPAHWGFIKCKKWLANGTWLSSIENPHIT